MQEVAFDRDSLNVLQEGNGYRAEVIVRVTETGGYQ